MAQEARGRSEDVVCGERVRLSLAATRTTAHRDEHFAWAHLIAPSGFSGASNGTPEHPRMARNLNADHESEPSTGKPRAQVRPQPLDPPIRTKLEHHRIVNPEWAHALELS